MGGFKFANWKDKHEILFYDYIFFTKFLQGFEKRPKLEKLILPPFFHSTANNIKNNEALQIELIYKLYFNQNVSDKFVGKMLLKWSCKYLTLL